MKPITRKEQFIQAAADGTTPPKPLTREELILSGADVTPLTRDEYYAEMQSGGGGGGWKEKTFLAKASSLISDFNTEFGDEASAVKEKIADGEASMTADSAYNPLGQTAIRMGFYVEGDTLMGNGTSNSGNQSYFYRTIHKLDGTSSTWAGIMMNGSTLTISNPSGDVTMSVTVVYR